MGACGAFDLGSNPSGSTRALFLLSKEKSLREKERKFDLGVPEASAEVQKDCALRGNETGKRRMEFIPAMDLLDSYLLEALRFLRDSPDENKGVVAAGIIDGERKVYATSIRAEDGKRWKHAERAALEKYLLEFGELPSGNAVAVTTLSMCIRDSAQRAGASCSDLLLGRDGDFPLESPFKRVHVGYVDPLQAESLEIYRELGFSEISVSREPKVALACEKISNYFSPETYGKVDRALYLKESLSGI